MKRLSVSFATFMMSMRNSGNIIILFGLILLLLIGIILFLIVSMDDSRNSNNKFKDTGLMQTKTDLLYLNNSG